MPLTFYPTLLRASEEEWNAMQVSPSSLHWELLDFGIEGLAARRKGTSEPRRESLAAPPATSARGCVSYFPCCQLEKNDRMLAVKVYDLVFRMDSDNPLSPHEVTKALNFHGIFFKKRVIEELRSLNGLKIVGEEQGVNFGETRVLDVLAADLQAEPGILFPIECKRGWRNRKQWFFFRDCNNVFRRVRSIGTLSSASVFSVGSDDMPVCSEGFELDMSKPPKDEQAHKSNQEPVFRAGSQLAAAVLGFVASRLRQFQNVGAGRGHHPERIVPVLVTNVEMFVVEGGDWSSVDLVTGSYNGNPELRPVKHVVLKQPFPTPEGYERDFREFPNSSPDMDNSFRNQLFTESLHVVSASGLLDFFDDEHRNDFRTAQTM